MTCFCSSRSWVSSVGQWSSRVAYCSTLAPLMLHGQSLTGIIKFGRVDGGSEIKAGPTLRGDALRRRVWHADLFARGHCSRCSPVGVGVGVGGGRVLPVPTSAAHCARGVHSPAKRTTKGTVLQQLRKRDRQRWRLDKPHLREGGGTQLYCHDIMTAPSTSHERTSAARRRPVPSPLAQGFAQQSLFRRQCCRHNAPFNTLNTPLCRDKGWALLRRKPLPSAPSTTTPSVIEADALTTAPGGTPTSAHPHRVGAECSRTALLPHRNRGQETPPPPPPPSLRVRDNVAVPCLRAIAALRQIAGSEDMRRGQAPKAGLAQVPQVQGRGPLQTTERVQVPQ